MALCYLHPDSPMRAYAGDAPFCERRAPFESDALLANHMRGKHAHFFKAIERTRREDMRTGNPRLKAWFTARLHEVWRRERQELLEAEQREQERQEQAERDREARYHSLVRQRDLRRLQRIEQAERDREEEAKREAERIAQEEAERHAAWLQGMRERFPAMAGYSDESIEKVIAIVEGRLPVMGLTWAEIDLMRHLEAEREGAAA